MEKKLLVKQIFGFQARTKQELPLFVATISAGFPSPAEEYVDHKLDLNEFLIKHPAATFFVKVEGDSMINAGIYSGDILIVDRALEPVDRKVIIAVLNGELTVKRIRKVAEKLYLEPENPSFRALEVTAEMDFQVWGVVTHVIHSV